MSRAALLFFIAVVGLSCERPDESSRDRQLASRALRNVLAYPQSSLVSFAAGENAAEIVLTSPASVDQIVTWYRQTFALNGWDVKSERTRRDTVTLYAEQRRSGDPVWITLRPNVGAPGTTYRLIGAILADSAVRDSATP